MYRPASWLKNCYVKEVSLVSHFFLLFSRFCSHLLLTNLTSRGCWQVLQHFAEFLSGCFPSTHWSPLSCKPPDPLLSLVGDPAFCPSCLLPLPCLAAFWLHHFHHPYFPSLISQLQVETFSYFCNDLLLLTRYVHWNYKLLMPWLISFFVGTQVLTFYAACMCNQDSDSLSPSYLAQR